MWEHYQMWYCSKGYPHVHVSFHWDFLVPRFRQCSESTLFMELEKHWANQELWLGRYGLCYPFAFHDPSRHSLSSLGGASFVWQVRFGIFGCVWVLESYFGYVVMVLWICFFRFGYMNTLELVLKFERRLIAFFLDFFVGCPHLSMPSRFSLEIWLLVINNLTADDVSPFPLPFCVWVCVYGIFGA